MRKCLRAEVRGSADVGKARLKCWSQRTSGHRDPSTSGLTHPGTPALRHPGTSVIQLLSQSRRTPNRFGDPVGRSRRRFHAPVQVVGVRADEVDAPVRLDERRPELGELAGAVAERFARRRPGIARPDDDDAPSRCLRTCPDSACETPPAPPRVTTPVAVPTSSPREVSTSSQVVHTWFNSRSSNSMLGVMPSLAPELRARLEDHARVEVVRNVLQRPRLVGRPGGLTGMGRSRTADIAQTR